MLIKTAHARCLWKCPREEQPVLLQMADIFGTILTNKLIHNMNLHTERQSMVIAFDTESIFGFLDVSGIKPETFTVVYTRFERIDSLIFDGEESPNCGKLAQEIDGFLDIQPMEVEIEYMKSENAAKSAGLEDIFVIADVPCDVNCLNEIEIDISDGNGLDAYLLDQNDEIIHQIFAEKPAVSQAYLNFVPKRMTEKEFWTKYSRAEYLHSTKNVVAAAAEAVEDEELAVFLKRDHMLANEARRKITTVDIEADEGDDYTDDCGLLRHQEDVIGGVEVI